MPEGHIQSLEAIASHYLAPSSCTPRSIAQRHICTTLAQSIAIADICAAWKMEASEATQFSPTLPEQSGYSSNESEDSPDLDAARSYSPPAWRKAGSGWFKHQPSLSPSTQLISREPSPEYQSADERNQSDAEDADTEQGSHAHAPHPLPTRIPLPVSPVKGRSPSISPEPAAQKLREPINPSRARSPGLSRKDQRRGQQINCEIRGSILRVSRRLTSLQTSGFRHR